MSKNTIHCKSNSRNKKYYSWHYDLQIHICGPYLDLTADKGCLRLLETAWIGSAKIGATAQINWERQWTVQVPAIVQVPFAAPFETPCKWRKYAVYKVFVFSKSSVWVLSGRYSVLQSVHQIYPKRILSEAGFGACFFFCTFHKTGAAVLCRNMIFLLIWTYFCICCTSQCNKTRCRRCK